MAGLRKIAPLLDLSKSPSAIDYNPESVSGGSMNFDWNKLATGGLGLLNLLFANDLPEPPSLSDAGISGKDIKNFFNLKRAITSAKTYGATANASKRLSSSLPSYLRGTQYATEQSSKLYADAAKKLADIDVQFSQQELGSMFQLYNAMMSRYQAELAAKQQENKGVSDVLDMIGLLALL